MKRKLVISFILISVFSIFFSIKNDVKASTMIDQYESKIGIEVIGIAEEFEKVNVTVKVYITETMKEFYEDNSLHYEIEEKPVKFLGITLWTKKLYYVYEERYMDVVTSRVAVKNDIDSLIYIVTKLENLAYDYLFENNGLFESEHENKRAITNLVLGYIRSFNKSYHNESFMDELTWSVVAGNVNTEFVDYVNSNDKYFFDFREYLAFFCNLNSYNEELHGDIDETKFKNKYLIDTVNKNRDSLNKIDLIHMFAVIDGTYDYTENSIITIQNNFQRDLSGWAGDLQTFTKLDVDNQNGIISKKNQYYDSYNNERNEPAELNSFIDYTINYSGNCISNEDLLGDIDAMNIVKLYLDGGETSFNASGEYNNLISSALSGYYNFVEHDNSLNYNRYKLFIESMAVDSFSNDGTSIEKFKEKVYLSLALIEDDGEIKENVIFPYTSIGYYHLRKSFMFTGLPTYDNRKYVAELFIDYILEMSTSPNITNKIKDPIDIHCNSNNFIETDELLNGQKVTYEFNILCNEYFSFECESIFEINMTLYDSSGNIIDSQPVKINNGTNALFVKLLDVGHYYLEITFANSQDYGEVDVIFGPRYAKEYREIIPNDTVNVIEHLHDGVNYFKFMRASANFYNMNIIMESYDSSTPPSCRIEMVNDETDEMKLYNFENGEPNLTNEYSHNIFFQTDEFVTFKITVLTDSLFLKKCDLIIRDVEEIEFDTLNSITKNEDIVIGDNIYNWSVKQTASYNISLSGSNALDTTYVILKKTSNGFENLYTKILTDEIFYYSTDIDLQYGDDIFLGYVNGQGKGELETTIERNISDEFSLRTDPNANVNVGTEVSLNGGSYGGTILTQGYTRICYLGSDAPYQQSRTQYYWYSSDENVAIVSAYGTVTGTATWEDDEDYKEVTIIAVYKENSQIIGKINLIVYKDNGSSEIEYLDYGFDVREGGTIAGTEVTNGKGDAISVASNPYVSIHVTYTRLICLGSDSPNSSVQAFNWRAYREYDTDTGMVNVSQFGTITGITTGWVTIEGTYKYNSRYKVKIRIYVESNI